MHADLTITQTRSGRTLMDRLGSFLATLHSRRNARRDMARLSQMSEQMLRDIGVTRDELHHLAQTLYRRA
ncbi:MAG TPA: DUF1127 domain-containing protein [Amaricoccus sp.]|uniref:DUF1127 domain-containing protein n=1 Tax=Amaricoccus sp. TaxID=1872485 RepID=UPI002CAED95A|nr:DUF1127 domain-containing protein [Amaricoccus sp.]HMQ92837.1 DUF1127 domain-containing protein [Amaricoccus sp.]HMR52859.1 DUF1127 domain-containing protein [Amaricoccus sp.]HMR60377.1 DUF1127 domain-containing protein [Amaricoccus sp.]HMT99794.1 DUF1127 domain-containing protein [Amaricoccus sp.]